MSKPTCKKECRWADPPEYLAKMFGEHLVAVCVVCGAGRFADK